MQWANERTAIAAAGRLVIGRGKRAFVVHAVRRKTGRPIYLPRYPSHQPVLLRPPPASHHLLTSRRLRNQPIRHLDQVRHLKRRKHHPRPLQIGQGFRIAPALQKGDAVVAEISAFAVPVIDHSPQRQCLFEQLPGRCGVNIEVQTAQRSQRVGFAEAVAEGAVGTEGMYNFWRWWY
ncbi:hypothetical protein [Chloroflexus aurantiacus]